MSWLAYLFALVAVVWSLVALHVASDAFTHARAADVHVRAVERRCR